MAITERREFKKREEQSCWKFFYNRDAGTVLGRTADSWMLITIFYSFFYSALAFFFALMMAAFYQTLDTERFPTYTPGDSSSLLRNPALGFRPSPRRENLDTSLISYYSDDPEDYRHWVDSLDYFIYDYKVVSVSGFSKMHLIDCDKNWYPSDDEVCMFDWLSIYDGCNSGGEWGYGKKQPCIILKMNRMIGWVPEIFYEDDYLPFDMPADLKNHINNTDPEMSRMVWVSCEGVGNADKALLGPIAYYPQPGFSANYFPYRNTPGYLSPLVAVHFLNPKPQALITIECKLWAKNIFHDRANRLGMVRFELLID